MEVDIPLKKETKPKLTIIIILALIIILRATSMDIHDPLSPLHPIIHHFLQVLRATSCILTELLYVHRRTSLMSSSLFLQQCPACLVHLTLIVFMIGGRWPYSCCVVEYCIQNLFNIAHSILV